MHANEAWIDMFRRIPANLHDGLTVGLRSGAEIAIQTILKLEPEFIIMRGRLTGTQEGGKILMMPYAEMTVLSIMRPMSDVEIEATFGKGAPPAPIDVPPVSAETSAPPAAPAAEPASDPAAAKKAEQATKSVMLAKLRERLKDAPPTAK